MSDDSHDAFDPTVSSPITEGEGATIGRYKLLQVIGEGGFGVVYMAEQTEPVTRRVALKIIKLGMDTRQVIARFEAERQALALMDHPNIAKVLDAGSTETGRPFFVMELVKGIPITKYCDDHKLSTEERLRLFLDVCNAIQHAHQKGIIHRDIKPSNILVTLHDGKPVPKVIDFGIAKATQTKLTDKTLFTRFEQIIGTPAYMSPEQAEMSGLDIDTRSDIYSLGVLLYELLTGQTPFDSKQLLSAGLDEMRRIIREQEPVRPSTRISSLEDKTRTTIAIARRSDANALRILFRKELDWIVLKAIEKDRTRRYETVEALKLEIARYLNNEPISACPPTASYRFQKFIRRHRIAAMAAGAVVLIGLIALASITVAFFRERDARLRVIRAEAGREQARLTAANESLKADAVANFAIDFIGGVVPELNHDGHRAAIRRLLEVGDRLAHNLTNAPLAQSRLRLSIGRAASESLLDDGVALPQFQKVDQLAGAIGPLAQPLALEARTRIFASRMWHELSEEAAIDLARLGQQFFTNIPPDIEAAVDAWAGAAEFFMENEAKVRATELANKAAAAAREHSINSRSRFDALYTLVQVQSERGDVTSAEKNADELLSIYRNALGSATDKPSPSIAELQNVLFINDWTLLPERSLRNVLARLEPHQRAERAIFETILGSVVARNGYWERGLALMHDGSKHRMPFFLWNVHTTLASLLYKTDLQISLTINGLAAYAGSADGDRCGWIGEQILMLPSHAAFLPTLTNIVERSRNVPNFLRWQFGGKYALFDYHFGKREDSLVTLDAFIEASPPGMARMTEPLHAYGHFLKSLILASGGAREAALGSYQQGLKLHPADFGTAGVRYSRPFYWMDACHAELMRRKAAMTLALPDR